MTARYESFDPFLGEAGAAAMLELCERFGSYGIYHDRPIESGLGAGLLERHDAVRNYVSTGGRFGRAEDLEQLAARTSYFRETYAYARPVVEGIEPLLHHAGLTEAARRLYDRPIVEPAIVYANLLVPGQELAVHTDVPEFRGINRTKDPQWLTVVMHHSGLFERWRMPIATGVSWYGRASGGAFAFYPDGPEGEAVALEVAHDTAVLLDTDSVFHGVDAVGGGERPPPPVEPGMRLAFAKGGWSLMRGDETVERYTREEVRFSVSWKAYCFADEEERRAWRDHDDDLDRDTVVARLVQVLRDRGRIGDEVPGDSELPILLFDEYIHFP